MSASDDQDQVAHTLYMGGTFSLLQECCKTSTVMVEASDEEGACAWSSQSEEDSSLELQVRVPKAPHILRVLGLPIMVCPAMPYEVQHLH